MITKRVNHNTVDVFIGEGWEGWSRFKIKYNKEGNQIFQIKGARLPKKQLIELEEKLK